MHFDECFNVTISRTWDGKINQRQIPASLNICPPVICLQSMWIPLSVCTVLFLIWKVVVVFHLDLCHIFKNWLYPLSSNLLKLLLSNNCHAFPWLVILFCCIILVLDSNFEFPVCHTLCVTSSDAGKRHLLLPDHAFFYLFH